MKAAMVLVVLLFLVFPALVACDEDNEGGHAVKHPLKNVIERKLVGEKANSKLIVKDNKRYALDTAQRNFKAETLAYVTPWNNHGYDIAKIFNKKFTYVAPVWLQIKLGETIQIGGLHDIDAGWIADVRKGATTKILPRVLFENIHSEQAARYLFSKVEEAKKLLVDLSLKHNFDGYVLEGLAPLTQLEDQALDFTRELAQALHQNSKEVILVVPPDSRAFAAKDFAAYSTFIDKFSVMTYDYSNFEQHGPIAPINWVEEVVNSLQAEDAGKIMMGLNFYGFNFVPSEKTGEAVVGETYIQLLKQYSPKISWDSSTAEHSFSYKEKSRQHVVYYPSLKSVYDRIKLAEKLGVSIAIWEIGQGLDYFYDLL